MRIQLEFDVKTDFVKGDTDFQIMMVQALSGYNDALYLLRQSVSTVGIIEQPTTLLNANWFVNQISADNGEHSHYEILDANTGGYIVREIDCEEIAKSICRAHNANKNTEITAGDK